MPPTKLSASPDKSRCHQTHSTLFSSKQNYTVLFPSNQEQCQYPDIVRSELLKLWTFQQNSRFIILSSFSDQHVCLPRRMVVAQCGIFPDVIHYAHFKVQKSSPIWTPKAENSPTSLFTEHRSNFSAVDYKHTEDKQPQMRRQTVVQNDDFPHFRQNWRQEAHLSEKCSAYRDKRISMLTKLQSMRDGHLGCVSVERHGIKLVDRKTLLVHLALHRAEQKTREFEKFKI